jgi:hypothetical protein
LLDPSLDRFGFRERGPSRLGPCLRGDFAALVPFAGIATPVAEVFRARRKFPILAIGLLSGCRAGSWKRDAGVGTALAIVVASLINMKTSRNIISFVIAADVALAILTVGALVAFAAFDYSRNTASLRARARILRPALPAAKVAPVVCTLDRAA